MGFQDKGVCLRMFHNVCAQHKDEMWHTATYCSYSGISNREYYGEKNLSDSFKQKNANNENSGTIVTGGSSKLIKVCLSLSY